MASHFSIYLKSNSEAFDDISLNNSERHIILNLINPENINMQESSSLTEGTHFLFGDNDFYEIVPFSNLDTYNLVFDLSGTLNGFDAYTAYSNGDLMLTVPEPSTANPQPPRAGCPHGTPSPQSIKKDCAYFLLVNLSKSATQSVR